MVASLEDVTNTLDSMAWKYIVKDDKENVLTGVVTDDYRDADGENRLGCSSDRRRRRDARGRCTSPAACRSSTMWHARSTSSTKPLPTSSPVRVGTQTTGKSPRTCIPIEQAVFRESMLERCIENVIEFFERYGSRIDEVLTRRPSPCPKRTISSR